MRDVSAAVRDALALRRWKQRGHAIGATGLTKGVVGEAARWWLAGAPPSMAMWFARNRDVPAALPLCAFVPDPPLPLP